MEEKNSAAMEIKSVRIPSEILALIKIKAIQQKCDDSYIIREALYLYLKQDIDSASLSQASLQNMRNDISFIEHKVDVLTRLFIFWLPYFFATSPELPQSEERKTMIDRAKTRTNSMLDQFKKDLKNVPSFLESLLADYTEIPEAEIEGKR